MMDVEQTRLWDEKILQCKCPECLQVFIKTVKPYNVFKTDDCYAFNCSCPACGAFKQYHIAKEDIDNE